MADLSPGSELAGCRIEEVLGTGGMGVIYRATELRLGRPVALKLIAADGASDPALRERFEREARLTASIDHPNVIPVYAAGEEDGHLYLVMRYVPGTDLHRAAARARAGSTPARAAASSPRSPTRSTPRTRPGSCTATSSRRTSSSRATTSTSATSASRAWRTPTPRITDSGGWVGTVDFMSPEHLRGEPTDARSDVYALGCVLYTALTGAPPFRRQTVPATITAHLHEPPPRPSETPGVPLAFDAVVARALAKDPADRYASAGDLGRAALAAAAGAPAATARGSVARGEATPERATPTAITSLADAAGVTAIAPTSLAAGRRRRARRPRPVPRPARTGTGRATAGAAATARDGARAHAPRPPPAPRGDADMARARSCRPPAVIAYVTLRDTGTPTGPLSTGEVTRHRRTRSPTPTRTRTSVSLRRLLTPEARRVGTSDGQNGRASVVGEYRRQFVAADVVIATRSPTCRSPAAGSAAPRATTP